MVWLESEKNRDKRLQMLDKFLAKEKAFLKEVYKDDAVRVLSSQKDMDET